MTVRIVPIGEVYPSTYNPRKADAERLDLVELSLRRLGWLLPIYADADGEILSGHQRHLIAHRLGSTHVPVSFADKAMPLELRKSVNVQFNRGTNDLVSSSTPTNLTEAIRKADVWSLTESIPDVERGSPKWFRCAHTKPRSVSELVVINSGSWNPYALGMAKSMRSLGFEMPIVMTPSGRVVNGIGRLQEAAERHCEFVDTVEVEDDEAALTGACLNLLSMDFDIHDKYADSLRYNSFRRARGLRSTLGLGFRFPLGPGNNDEFKLLDTATKRKIYRTKIGRTILDFGAGRGTETVHLRECGFDATGFDPFTPTPLKDTADLELSRASARGFLERVPSTRWDAIFSASVLNSVPFASDRRHMITILAALTTTNTRIFAVAGSVKSTRAKEAFGKKTTDPAGALTFPLEYEPNTTIGGFRTEVKPKVQHFFTDDEWLGLWKERFDAVHVGTLNRLVVAIATKPRPVPPDDLNAALAFEFDLPHKDGRLGLAEVAIAAFGERRAAGLIA